VSAVFSEPEIQHMKKQRFVDLRRSPRMVNGCFVSRILGIEENTAKLDADGIERHVQKNTIIRIGHFVGFVDRHPSWFKVFENAQTA
jgi:Mn-dependent DtxR family transcriptional regulator